MIQKEIKKLLFNVGTLDHENYLFIPSILLCFNGHQ